jgi:spermidine synthase
VTPYLASVPSFGDWGFLLTSPGTQAGPALQLPADAPPLRYLSEDVLRAATVFPPDRRVTDAEVSTLLDPVVLEYVREEWRAY